MEWTGNFAVIIKDIRSHRLQYFSEYFFRLEFPIIHNLSKVLLIFSARNFLVLGLTLLLIYFTQEVVLSLSVTISISFTSRIVGRKTNICFIRSLIWSTSQDIKWKSISYSRENDRAYKLINSFIAFIFELFLIYVNLSKFTSNHIWKIICWN